MKSKYIGKYIRINTNKFYGTRQIKKGTYGKIVGYGDVPKHYIVKILGRKYHIMDSYIEDKQNQLK